MDILLLLRRRLLIVLLIGLSCLGVVLAQNSTAATRPTPLLAVQQPIQPTSDPLTARPITPVPPQNGLEPTKIALGRRLFNDSQLSKGGQFSCASCHSLQLGGADGRARPLEQDNQPGNLNTPTVFNASLNFKQFWDGRAATLEDQIEGPIHNPREMATNWPEVVAKLQKDPRYLEAFRQAYPQGIQVNTVKDAIATFERSLTTPNAPFDRYLNGETTAISASEQAGYGKFKDYGCIACHQGVNLGGNMYQSMGVMADYFQDRGNVTHADYGRFNQTGDYRDRYTFKVPSLRNIELTAPYFHDGTVKTLPEAVNMMAKYQLGRPIPQKDVDLIVQFLKTLTGEIPKEDA